MTRFLFQRLSLLGLSLSIKDKTTADINRERLPATKVRTLQSSPI